ncbi:MULTISPECIES: hypothetical protein [Kosakonia]|uniref:hypothetical protein n=1 Tax=Kosakonia TaxID=1330547 RepID=UPI0005F00496|nr:MULTISPECIES: hypothetical protein [Kosakonia]
MTANKQAGIVLVAVQQAGLISREALGFDNMPGLFTSFPSALFPQRFFRRRIIFPSHSLFYASHRRNTVAHFSDRIADAVTRFKKLALLFKRK